MTETTIRRATPLSPGGEPTHAAPTTKTRIRSLDVARGIVVATSVMITNLPGLDAPAWIDHAQWYGLTVIDVYLPTFLFLFGSGIAIAYRRGVKYRRLVRRTVLLAVYGVIFNGIVGWNFDLATIRLTSVLLVFSIVGLAVTLVTRLATTWWQALVVAGVALGGHWALLQRVAEACQVPLPTQTCNPSGIIDVAIFGAVHVYRGGTTGFDPEGVGIYLGVASTVLLGFAGGKLLWSHREGGAAGRLLVYGAVLFAATPALHAFIPYSKKLWTPSFVVFCAGVGAVMLALLNALIDRRALKPTGIAEKLITGLQAFGRNSLLVYFGKFIVTAVLLNVTVPGSDESLRSAIVASLGGEAGYVPWVYMVIMITCWSVVVWALDRKALYFKA